MDCLTTAERGAGTHVTLSLIHIYRGKSRQIEATGWYARILQHEIDHLNGTLYVDRMRIRTFCTVDNFSRHWKTMRVTDAVAAAGETASPV